MAFKMTVSKDKLEGMKPLPAGTYEFQLAGFEPKAAKNGESINLNPVLKVVNHPQYAGQRVFYNLNTKAAWIFADFAHCFGLNIVFEKDENGNEVVALPGGSKAWIPDANEPDNVEKVRYEGPLTGLVGKIEVVEKHQPGQKPRNDVKQFICAIDGCAQKNPNISHSSNLSK